MPGGNTSSRKRPYGTIKWGSNKSPDMQAIVGGELIYPGADMEYGLGFFGPTPESPNSDHGVYEAKTTDVGKAVGPRRGKPKNVGSFPGF
jgi:hypothetical protein